MKNLKMTKVAYLLWFTIAICLTGCEKEDSEKTGELDISSMTLSVSTNQVEKRTDKTATAIGTISGLTESIQPTTYGICYSNSNVTPNIQNDFKIQGTMLENGQYSAILTNLTGGTTYYYRAYAEYANTCYYGSIKQFKTRPADDGNDIPTEGQPVDLGLSVKWSSWNVGATKPEEYGGLYGWGDPTGSAQWQCGDHMETNYKPEATCYEYYGGVSPVANICSTQYDIAHIKWGDTWRLPTNKELQELVDKCNWKKIIYKGAVGRLLIGPNGNKIFLPSAGRRYGATTYSQDEQGRYWSGILEPDKNINVESLKKKLAYMLCFEKNEIVPDNTANSTSGILRYVGGSVRPVIK